MNSNNISSTHIATIIITITTTHKYNSTIKPNFFLYHQYIKKPIAFIIQPVNNDPIIIAILNNLDLLLSPCGVTDVGFSNNGFTDFESGNEDVIIVEVVTEVKYIVDVTVDVFVKNKFEHSVKFSDVNNGNCSNDPNKKDV
ncbi:hypothetical protein RclHR1_06380011 [Rhizophagus clarus]|uniref:Uncharacterized protein n=1 Tax=Rhizophagus clarus TaxID=94130 RepID=A0A2Z6S8J1_9GLOM|nr:hypothetical protein RclHR1_06380011 [Rhizophagus clarus]